MKNYVIISTWQKETFDKTHHSFIMKILSKLRIEGNYLNVIKTI